MIYYPHYTPSKQHLRSILLFSDQINLIVPEVDQDGVKQRGNVSDILAKRPEFIELKDPEYHYGGWANKPNMDIVVQNILSDATRQICNDGVETLKTDNYGNIENGQENQLEVLHSKCGWKFVAAQKFPPQVQDAVFESRCAARAGVFRDKKTGNVVEHHGVICHPLLANFILCRMAREASFVEASPSITFGSLNYMDHLLDGEQPMLSPQQTLMQASLELFVPDNLHRLHVDDFISVRSDYTDLRSSVCAYLNSIALVQNLNMTPADQGALLTRLAKILDKIEIDMAKATKSVGRQRFMSKTAFALEAAATMGGAAVGALFSGPAGAIAGAGLGFAGGKIAHKLSTIENSNGPLSSVAMTKAKVERMGLRKQWDAPRYWRP